MPISSEEEDTSEVSGIDPATGNLPTPSDAERMRAERIAINREAQRESRVKAWMAWFDRSFTRRFLYPALTPAESAAATDEERRWEVFEEQQAVRMADFERQHHPPHGHGHRHGHGDGHGYGQGGAGGARSTDREVELT